MGKSSQECCECMSNSSCNWANISVCSKSFFCSDNDRVCAFYEINRCVNGDNGLLRAPKPVYERPLGQFLVACGYRLAPDQGEVTTMMYPTTVALAGSTGPPKSPTGLP